MKTIDFEKNPDEVEQIPEILEKYLNNVARSGDIVYKWEQIRPFLKKKIEIIAAEFNETHPFSPESHQPNVKPFDFDEIKRNILNGIDSFTGAPFTIQRICELLTDPYRHYKRADKFLKGLEKNVMVISEEIDEHRSENGNTSVSICLSSTFTLPSTSDSINQQPSTFHNGYKENESEFIHNNLPPHQATSTIQQLDSFTTVFVSSSQTNSSPLERIANLPILESTNNSSTNSCLTSSPHQPNTTITPIADPATDNNLDKIQQIEQQDSSPVDQAPQQTDSVIIETVNTDEQTPLTSLEQQSGEKVVLVQEDENKQDETEKSAEFASMESSSSIDVLKEETNQQAVTSESNKIDSEQVEQQPNVEEEAENQESRINVVEEPRTPVKENQVNELKRRVCDSPDVEPMKRFKSNDNTEQSEFNQSETIEQSSQGDKLISDEKSDNELSSEQPQTVEPQEIKEEDNRQSIEQSPSEPVNQQSNELNQIESEMNTSDEKPVDPVQSETNDQQETEPAHLDNELVAENKNDLGSE